CHLPGSEELREPLRTRPPRRRRAKCGRRLAARAPRLDPEGPDDPAVALLGFEPAAGEHWEHGLLDAAKIRIDQARAKVAARGAKDTKGAKAHAHDRVPLEHRR